MVMTPNLGLSSRTSDLRGQSSAGAMRRCRRSDGDHDTRRLQDLQATAQQERPSRFVYVAQATTTQVAKTLNLATPSISTHTCKNHTQSTLQQPQVTQLTELSPIQTLSGVTLGTFQRGNIMQSVILKSLLLLHNIFGCLSLFDGFVRVIEVEFFRLGITACPRGRRGVISRRCVGVFLWRSIRVR